MPEVQLGVGALLVLAVLELSLLEVLDELAAPSPEEGVVGVDDELAVELDFDPGRLSVL